MHSWGSGLYYGDTSTTINTELARIVNVDDDDMVKSSDKTHLKSTGADREYEPGMGDPGEITLTFRFEKTQFAALLAIRRSTKWFKIVDADASTLVGQGFWTKRSKKIPDDDQVVCDVTIKKTGAWTFTQGP